MRYVRALPYSNGKVGVFGTCSGGRHAYLAACRTPGFDAVVAKVKSIPEYPSAFQRVFGRDVVIGDVARAIAAFERTQFAGNAPFAAGCSVVSFEAPTSDAPDLAKIIREEMESAMTLKVPLRAEAGLGPDWMSAK